MGLLNQNEGSLKDELKEQISIGKCILCSKGSEIEWRLETVEAGLKLLELKNRNDLKDINSKWNEDIKDIYVKWDRLNNLIIGTLITAIMTLIGVTALFLKG